jgi:hypothetical protein
MDRPLNNFGSKEASELDEQLCDLDLEELWDSHPELALKLEEHTQEIGYE